MTSDQLKNKHSENSNLKGSQKLFFSLQKRNEGDDDDIFVNNAKFVTRDLTSQSSSGYKQVRSEPIAVMGLCDSCAQSDIYKVWRYQKVSGLML